MSEAFEDLVQRYRHVGIRKGSSLLFHPKDALDFANDLASAGFCITGLEYWFYGGDQPNDMQYIVEDPVAPEFDNLLWRKDAVTATCNAAKEQILYYLPNHIDLVSFVVDDSPNISRFLLERTKRLLNIHLSPDVVINYWHEAKSDVIMTGNFLIFDIRISISSLSNGLLAGVRTQIDRFEQIRFVDNELINIEIRHGRVGAGSITVERISRLGFDSSQRLSRISIPWSEPKSVIPHIDPHNALSGIYYQASEE